MLSQNSANLGFQLCLMFFQRYLKQQANLPGTKDVSSYSQSTNIVSKTLLQIWT